MALSEQTIREMAAGAANVAAHVGKHGIEPEYMEAMIRTQQRAAWLSALQRDGEVRIERQNRPRTNDPNSGPSFTTTVWVGKNSFSDPSGELTGSWPSEVLVAQVAMALAAGEGEPKKEQVLASFYDERTKEFKQRVRIFNQVDHTQYIDVERVDDHI